MKENDRGRRAHLVGIRGSGMQALARTLLDKGWQLSGSDVAAVEDDPLVKAGIRCFSGHVAEQLGADVECLIYSSAVGPTNPELLRAIDLGIPTLSYAEMLGALIHGHRGLAIAGTHGKSTTTAMAAQILVTAGCDPTVIYGATPKDGGEGGRAGSGNAVLVEACEYRHNFLHLHPHDAAILNIEPDHFDCYESRDALEAAFARFAQDLPSDGCLIVPWGDGVVGRVSSTASCQVESFGLSTEFGDEFGVAARAADVQSGQALPAAPSSLPSTPDWVATDVKGRRGRYNFQLVHHGRKLGRIELSVFGRHNVFNAVAAAAIAHRCDVSAEAIVAGLSQFRGLKRRLELLGTAGEVVFWDDYAHHPSEIASTLQAVREVEPRARVCCLFQPHQALRTARLLDELASSLQNAERVLIAEIYRAREGPPLPGEIVAADLAARTRALGQDVPGLHAPADIQQFLQTRLTPGDVLVVMGAGDIGRITYGLMDWFRKNRAAG